MKLPKSAKNQFLDNWIPTHQVFWTIFYRFDLWMFPVSNTDFEKQLFSLTAFVIHWTTAVCSVYYDMVFSVYGIWPNSWSCAANYIGQTLCITQRLWQYLGKFCMLLPPNNKEWAVMSIQFQNSTLNKSTFLVSKSRLNTEQVSFSGMHSTHICLLFGAV